MQSTLIFEDGKLPLENGRLVSYNEFFKQFSEIPHGAAQGLGIEIVLPFEFKGKNKKYEQLFVRGQTFRSEFPEIYRQFISYLRSFD